MDWLSLFLAHTTQFTKPGYYYLKRGYGSGFLDNGGSYVTFVDSDTKDFTMVIETMVRLNCNGKHVLCLFSPFSLTITLCVSDHHYLSTRWKTKMQFLYLEAIWWVTVNVYVCVWGGGGILACNGTQCCSVFRKRPQNCITGNHPSCLRMERCLSTSKKCHLYRWTFASCTLIYTFIDRRKIDASVTILLYE